MNKGALASFSLSYATLCIFIALLNYNSIDKSTPSINNNKV